MKRMQAVLCAIGGHRWRQRVYRIPELVIYDDGAGHTVTRCAAWYWGPEVKCTACGKTDLRWNRPFGMRTTQ